MRPPNAPPGLPQHPVPSLCGTPGLYTNRHAVSYFTALLCGIPLSTEGVRVGVGVKVGVAVKVGTARIAKEGVGTAAGRPRAAQPAATSRQSNSVRALRARRPRRGAGQTEMRRHLGRSEEQGEQVRIVAQGAGRWASSESCGPNAHYILSSMTAASCVRTSDPILCSPYQRDLRLRLLLRPRRDSTQPARIMFPMPTIHQPPTNASTPMAKRSIATISR